MKAYCVAFINYRTNVVERYGIFSEETPTVEGPYLTAVIATSVGSDYAEARDRLSDYIKRLYPILPI